MRNFQKYEILSRLPLLWRKHQFIGNNTALARRGIRVQMKLWELYSDSNWCTGSKFFHPMDIEIGRDIHLFWYNNSIYTAKSVCTDIHTTYKIDINHGFSLELKSIGSIDFPGVYLYMYQKITLKISFESVLPNQYTYLWKYTERKD